MFRVDHSGKKAYKAFFTPKDIGLLSFPSKWSNGYVDHVMTEFDVPSAREFWKHVLPTVIFEGDGEENGFLCMKPLGGLREGRREGRDGVGGSGAAKHKQTDAYVNYADHKLTYRVYLDGRRKCIHVSGKHLYLSDIRGKYRNVK